MALVTYPLNNVDYSAEDAELFHCTRSSGVYASEDFSISVTGADCSVTIGAGIGWIRNSRFSGKVIAQKAAVALDMGLSDATYPRIDAVVLQFDANTNQTELVVKSGTAATTPAAPEVVRTESLYELHLYQVRRSAGSAVVTASDIVDLRMNTAYCGLMADSVTKVDTDAIRVQIENLIDELENKIAAVEDGSAYYNKDQIAEMLTGYARNDHNHDGTYAASGHNHSGVYSPSGHDHTGTYAPLSHNHDAAYAEKTHNHDGTYAASGHNHDGTYVKPSGGTMTGALTLNGIYLTSGVDYGTTLPSTAPAGKLFFKKVTN